MTETAEPKKSSLLKKLLKFGLVSFVLGFIFLTILSRVGGSGDAYKEFIEGFLSDATGYTAHVEKVNEVEFFPDIIFDFEHAALYAAEGEDIPIAGLGNFRVARSFWATIFNLDSWKALEVKKVYADPGIFMDQGFKINHAGLVEKEGEDKGIFRLSGQLGKDTPVKAEIELVMKTQGTTKLFSLEGDRLFSFKMGKIDLSGDTVKEGSGKRFKDLKLTFDGQDVLTGDVLLSNGVTGEMQLSEKGSILHPDIEINQEKAGWGILGRIKSPLFNISDFSGSSRLMTLVDYVEGLFAKTQKDEESLFLPRLDLRLDVEKLMAGKTELGQVKITAKTQDGQLKIQPQGSVASGELSGQIEINAANSPAELLANLKIKNMNYGSLQGAMNGAGNAVIDLKAKGTSWGALKKDLSGTIDFVGGKGVFSSSAANIWGGGLLNAMLPENRAKDSLAINCAIIDFTVDKGIATSNALFVDGQQVTIAGKGSYNIAEDKLDISLKPKSKGVAFGSLASAVKIKGSIGNPSFSPDIIDFGTKIGGMLLGAINPAFLALSLTDLGLSEDHPCASYIKATPETTE